MQSLLRKSLIVSCLVATTLGAMPAFAGGAAQAAAGRPDAIQPNALLTIDQNRTTVVDRIMSEWGEALAKSGAGLTKEQLRTVLTGLRADHLLAAGMAGSLEGLRNVVANSLIVNEPNASTPVAASLLQTKALGDVGDDLVYTPVTPCRIVDTRLGAGGILLGEQIRNWRAANPAGNFASQGGATTNCGIPVKPAAVMVNITVFNTGGGPAFMTAWPFNQAQPNASLINWIAAGDQVANAVAVPLCTGGGCTFDFSVFTTSQANMVFDVLGYFAAPGAPVGVVSNIARWDGLVEPIPGGNASIWTFAGGTATVTLPAGPARRLTAYGVAAMATSSGTQLAWVNICYQNQSGPPNVREFRPASFLSLPFTTTVSSYTAGDSVVLPGGTYKVGLCVNNNQGPIAIDANDWSHGWVMVTSD